MPWPIIAIANEIQHCEDEALGRLREGARGWAARPVIAACLGSRGDR
jgi:hypothetical protein